MLDSASLPHTLTRHGPRAGTDCGPVCVTYGYYCYNLFCYCIQPRTTSGDVLRVADTCCLRSCHAYEHDTAEPAAARYGRTLKADKSATRQRTETDARVDCMQGIVQVAKERERSRTNTLARARALTHKRARTHKHNVP